jgi:DNA-binding transcriptional LysR family regulator
VEAQVLELRQLHLFVGVAEELHFGRAATRLFITQPALSRQVRGLESALGVELLVRAHGRVCLTTAGYVLLDHARRLLTDAQAVEDAVRRASRSPPDRVEAPSNVERRT